MYEYDEVKTLHTAKYSKKTHNKIIIKNIINNNNDNNKNIIFYRSIITLEIVIRIFKKKKMIHLN